MERIRVAYEKQSPERAKRPTTTMGKASSGQEWIVWWHQSSIRPGWDFSKREVALLQVGVLTH